MDIRGELGEAEPHPNEEALVENIRKENDHMIDRTKPKLSRAQHPKLFGWVAAEFTASVADDALKVGLFAQTGPLEALVRFSSGLRVDDRDDDADGMAIRFLGVPGDRADPSLPQQDCVDLVLLDNETFMTGDLEEYDVLNDLMAEVVHSKRNKRNNLIGTINGLYLKFGRKLLTGKDIFAKAESVSADRPVSPLRAMYWSTTPYLLGDKAVKYFVTPVETPSNAELVGGVNEMDGLSKALKEGMENAPVDFKVMLDIQQDVTRQPVEDPTVEWSAAGARQVEVGTLRLTRLLSDSEALEKESEIAFNPWQTLAVQRPLGTINRVRGKVYHALAEARRKQGG